MYSHLSVLQISHADVRWANIVSAPESTSGPPNRRCAHHGKYHPWRIVDFELSKKTLSDAGECNLHSFLLLRNGHSTRLKLVFS